MQYDKYNNVHKLTILCKSIKTEVIIIIKKISTGTQYDTSVQLCDLMCAMALHVILAIIFQVAKMTIFPLSVNKINFVHLIYEPQEIYKGFTIIKLNIYY